MRSHLPDEDGGALCGVRGAIVFAAGTHYDDEGAYLFDTDGKPTDSCMGCLALAVSAAVLEWRSIQEQKDDRSRETSIRTVATLHRRDRSGHAISQRHCRHDLLGLYRRRCYRGRRERSYLWALGPQS